MYSKVYLFLLVTLFLSCGRVSKDSPDIDISTDVTEASIPDTFVTPETAKKQVSLMDTILKGNNIIIVGDTANGVADAIDYIALRFKPYLRYSDFSATEYKGKVKSTIRYDSNPIARRYRTIITDTYNSEGVNFGGHYTFIDWGCGSPCQSSALVDLKTGIVYDGVDAAGGYEFRKDSRLLIVNPPDSTGFYLDCAYCEPEVYIWNEQSKKFEQR